MDDHIVEPNLSSDSINDDDLSEGLASDKDSCVIFLHGNSGNRCSSLTAVKHLVRHRIPVAAFDFSGCGYSDGKYITLGTMLTLLLI